MSILRTIELWLQQRIEGTSGLVGDIEPLDLIRQVEREIERNRKVFVNDEIYVPHRLVVHLFAPSVAKVEEYEALFNTPSFRGWIEAHINERGYKLLDRLSVAIECHQEPQPEFKNKACWVEFSWAHRSGDPADYTVVIDPKDDTRILSVEAGQPEVPLSAALEVLSGEAFQSHVPLSRVTTNIGRTEHILDGNARRIVRVNHLAFLRADRPDAISHTISRRHAHISFVGGQFRVFDDGSQNGTRVERGGTSLPVPKATASAAGLPLEDGDVLVIGRARVRLTVSKATVGPPSS